MIFCSVVMVSSNRRGGALRNPDQLRAPPRLAIRRGEPGHRCQIKFWLTQVIARAAIVTGNEIYLGACVCGPCASSSSENDYYYYLLIQVLEQLALDRLLGLAPGLLPKALLQC